MNKLERNIEILKRKTQSIEESKGKNADSKIGDETERFMLNMEMLTWIVNTDSLLLSTSPEYKSQKMYFKDTRDGNGCHGILLGLYYAFNCFKHNMQIYSLEKIDEITFFQYSIANNVRLETSELNSLRQEYKFYIHYLVDKNVFETFSRAVHFLNSQYEIIKKKQDKVKALENKQKV